MNGILLLNILHGIQCDLNVLMGNNTFGSIWLTLSPLFKESYLLNSTYVSNCLKFTIHLKTSNLIKSKNDNTKWNAQQRACMLLFSGQRWLHICKCTTKKQASRRGLEAGSLVARWSRVEWSLRGVPNHSNDVNTLLLFALSVRPPVRCFKELPGPFT